MSGKHSPDPAFAVRAIFSAILCFGIVLWWFMLGK